MTKSTLAQFESTALVTPEYAVGVLTGDDGVFKYVANRAGDRVFFDVHQHTVAGDVIHKIIVDRGFGRLISSRMEK